MPSTFDDIALLLGACVACPAERVVHPAPSDRGSPAGPPPPFVAPFASSLRTHFRGDPPPKPAAAKGRSAQGFVLSRRQRPRGR